MRKYIRNRSIISIFILLILIISNVAGDVYAITPIVEEISHQILTKGVTHQNIMRFHRDGWLNVNAIFVDISEEEAIQLKLLRSINGVSNRETLSSMVAREENVVAAINGDFFFTTSPSSATGAIIENGEVISTPTRATDLATFFISNEGLAYIQHFLYELYIVVNSNHRINLGSINKNQWRYQEIMLINKDWGRRSIGAVDDFMDMVEVVVEDNIVQEVRVGQPPVDIPHNGYVLLSAGPQRERLLRLQVGDHLDVNLKLNPDISRVNLAMGGGSILVRNGRTANFTQDLSGNHPRTAIGITEDRKQLILVTVDGRHQSFRGVNGQQLANIMIELGSHEAINLDGGGSTTMMARNVGTTNPTVINHPSDGTERRIINALAVLSTAPMGPPKDILIEVEDSSLFRGASRRINVRALDTFYNPITVDRNRINYTIVEGTGRVENHIFYSDTSGRVVVDVEYMGITSQVTFHVLEEISHLDIWPRVHRINNNRNFPLRVTGITPSGYRIPIENRDVQWKDVNGIGTFENGMFNSGTGRGETIIEATFRDLKINSIFGVGNNQVVIDNFESLNHQFLRYPSEVTGSVALSDLARTGNHSLMLEYDFTNTEATRAAFITFGDRGLPFPNSPTRLGVWVYAYETAPHWIRGRLIDDLGNHHIIDFAGEINWTGWKLLEATVPNTINAVAIDRLYVAETSPNDRRTGRLLFDDLHGTFVIPLTLTDRLINPIIRDNLNRPSENGGTRLFVHPGHQYTKETLLDRIVSNRIVSVINSRYNYGLFTGRLVGNTTNRINVPILLPGRQHFSRVIDNSLFIYLDNSNNGIRQTNFEQWPWLLNQLNGSNQDNLFISISRGISEERGFSDPLEEKLFMEILTREAEKGKNVFVIFEGSSTAVTPINGVRYVSIEGSRPSVNRPPGEALRYIEININGTEVTYQIQPLFN